MGVNFRKRQSIILTGVYRVMPDLDRQKCIPAGITDGRSGMFLTRWNGAHSRTAWVRGRLARSQQRDPSRERGHLGSEGIVPSAASRGWDALLGARASRPRIAAGPNNAVQMRPVSVVPDQTPKCRPPPNVLRSPPPSANGIHNGDKGD